MRRLIVLRPEPGAGATVERARQRGLEASATPLFEIRPVPWDVPDVRAFDALLLTSANAVRCAGPGLERLRALPVHAVGEATARAASEAGLTVASIGSGGADALLATIDPRAKLLHLCGEHRRRPADARRPITPVVAYRSKPLDPPPDFAEAQGSVVLVHSPRAGQRLAELIADRATIAIAAVSPAAADSVGSGWEAIAAADSPTADALLALAEQLCEKAPRG